MSQESSQAPGSGVIYRADPPQKGAVVELRAGRMSPVPVTLEIVDWSAQTLAARAPLGSVGLSLGETLRGAIVASERGRHLLEELRVTSVALHSADGVVWLRVGLVAPQVDPQLALVLADVPRSDDPSPGAPEASAPGAARSVPQA